MEKYITEHERELLLSELHAHLFWVGQRIPNHITIEGKDYRLHDYVWDLIQKDTLSEADKTAIDKCIDIISHKEEEDLQCLKENCLTETAAQNLYHETAGLLRAITDLKDIESGAMKANTKSFQDKFAEQKIKSIRLWLDFIKDVKQ